MVFFFGNIVAWFGFEPKIHASKMNKLVFFSPFLDDTKPIVFQILYRRDLMNTILHKLKIFAVILAILIGNGKTILVYALLLRRFDFNILWNLYYELL